MTDFFSKNSKIFRKEEINNWSSYGAILNDTFLSELFDQQYLGTSLFSCSLFFFSSLLGNEHFRVGVFENLPVPAYNNWVQEFVVVHVIFSYLHII